MNLGWLDPRAFWRILKEAFIEWDKDNVSRLAAALAYYATFSLAPLLVVVVGLAGILFGREAASGEIVEQIQGLIGPQGAEIIATVIERAGRPESGILATVIGLVTLFIGATGAFNQLQSGLNTVWEVAPKPRGVVRGLLRRRIIAFTMVLGTGFLLLVSLVLSAGLEAFGDYLQGYLPPLPFGPSLLNSVFSFLMITLLFAMIYNILPDAEVPWRGVWLGAAVTSLLFTAGKHLIGLYLGNSSVGSAYGAAGTLAVLLIWIYFSAQIFYFGAEITQVYTRHRGVPIRPSPHATGMVRVRIQAGTPEEAREAVAEKLEVSPEAVTMPASAGGVTVVRKPRWRAGGMAPATAPAAREKAPAAGTTVVTRAARVPAVEPPGAVAIAGSARPTPVEWPTAGNGRPQRADEEARLDRLAGVVAGLVVGLVVGALSLQQAVELWKEDRTE